MYEGEILALVGPNGAGKTTLVRIISGTLRPTEGQVSVHGHDIQRDRGRRADIAVVPQDSRPDPLLTPAEHVRYYLVARGWPGRKARARALSMLTALGLEAERDVPAHRLSGGMQRRILLAMALATGATLLLLDEPTSGLDLAARQELWRLLALTKTHAAVLLTTHDLHEAEVLADRVTILHEGVVRRTGTVLELRAMLRHRDKFVVEVPPDSPLLVELGALGECRALAGRTVLYSPDGRAVDTAARLASMHLSFSAQPTTLEDVYMDLLAQNDPDRASLVDA